MLKHLSVYFWFWLGMVCLVLMIYTAKQEYGLAVLYCNLAHYLHIINHRNQLLADIYLKELSYRYGFNNEEDE